MTLHILHNRNTYIAVDRSIARDQIDQFNTASNTETKRWIDPSLSKQQKEKAIEGICWA